MAHGWSFHRRRLTVSKDRSSPEADLKNWHLNLVGLADGETRPERLFQSR